MQPETLDNITTACQALALTWKLNGRLVPQWTCVNSFGTPGFALEVYSAKRRGQEVVSNYLSIVTSALTPYLPEAWQAMPFSERRNIIQESVKGFVTRQAYRREHRGWQS